MPNNSSILKNLSVCVALAALITVAAPIALADQKNKVLAKIGNQTVTESDLEQMAGAVPEKFRHLYLTPEGRKKTMEYIVNVYVLSAEAKNEGLDRTPEVRKLLDFTAKDLLARLYLDKKSKNLPEPTESEAKAYYEKNRTQYQTPESVHLRHILVKTEKEAQKVLEQLKKGQDFAELAKKVSICPSKSTGGDLDWVPKGNLLPEIEAATSSMQNGQITGPVKSKFGYHVLLMEGKRPATESSFDEVKDYVMEQLKLQKRQDFYEKLAKSLRNKMNVQITDLALTSAGAKPAAAAKPAGPTAGPKN